MASFPRPSPPAPAAAPLSIVPGEEAAAVSSRTPAPRWAVKANANSGHSPRRGQPGAWTDPPRSTHRRGDRPGQRPAVPAASDPGRGRSQAERTGQGPGGAADRLLSPPRDPGRGRSSGRHLRGRPASRAQGSNLPASASASCHVGRALCRAGLGARRALGGTHGTPGAPRAGTPEMSLGVAKRTFEKAKLDCPSDSELLSFSVPPFSGKTRKTVEPIPPSFCYGDSMG